MEFNYALLVKYLIGSLSSEEMEEVMRWRDLSAENETVFFLKCYVCVFRGIQQSMRITSG